MAAVLTREKTTETAEVARGGPRDKELPVPPWHGRYAAYLV